MAIKRKKVKTKGNAEAKRNKAPRAENNLINSPLRKGFTRK